MILTEKIELKVSKKNICHLRNKGYDCNLKDIIEIKPDDLQEGSHVKIEVKCDICGRKKELKFQVYNKCYNNGLIYVCNNCSIEKIKKTNMEKYGCECSLNNKDIQEKMKKNCLEKYGVEFSSQRQDVRKKISEINSKNYCDEIRQKTIKTNIERYGCETPTQNKEVLKKREDGYMEKYGQITNLLCDDTKIKIKKTLMERYGVENASQSDVIKKRKENTCMKNHGTINPLQNKEIFEKTQISSYKMTIIEGHLCRGSYEKDFILNFHEKIKIEKPSSVKYIYKEKNKVYHPDFYIRELNLIVEIKSSYTYKYNIEMNENKKKACLEQGFNFIFIINKDYTDFEKLIKNQCLSLE